MEAYKPAPDRLDYAASKGAINNLSKGLSQLLVERGIRVNVVAPGPTWTVLQPSGGVDLSTLPEFGSSESPMGRAGQPAELAPAYVFLAPDESSYVVGETLNVNGDGHALTCTARRAPTGRSTARTDLRYIVSRNGRVRLQHPTIPAHEAPRARRRGLPLLACRRVLGPTVLRTAGPRRRGVVDHRRDRPRRPDAHARLAGPGGRRGPRRPALRRGSRALAAVSAGTVGRIAATVATVWTALVLAGLAVWATGTGEAGWGVVVMTAATVGSVLALALVLLGRVPTEWLTSGPLRFRTADPGAATSRHVVATTVQIVVFWGCSSGCSPWPSPSPSTAGGCTPHYPDRS
ncbi:SDR family oxidoreductase [Sphingomonas sp. LR61]|uniref:SDR family oxidoreductase n=1 Tax=Sphingomonas sp. LR61 TaxID=3050234 RepID=UPI002FDFBE9C